jgi:hypothetical protein
MINTCAAFILMPSSSAIAAAKTASVVEGKEY